MFESWPVWHMPGTTNVMRPNCSFPEKFCTTSVVAFGVLFGKLRTCAMHAASVGADGGLRSSAPPGPSFTTSASGDWLQVRRSGLCFRA